MAGHNWSDSETSMWMRARYLHYTKLINDVNNSLLTEYNYRHVSFVHGYIERNKKSAKETTVNMSVVGLSTFTPRMTGPKYTTVDLLFTLYELRENFFFKLCRQFYLNLFHLSLFQLPCGRVNKRLTLMKAMELKPAHLFLNCIINDLRASEEI